MPTFHKLVKGHALLIRPSSIIKCPKALLHELTKNNFVV